MTELYPYQRELVDKLCSADSKALFIDMGFGKTAIVLHALRFIMTEYNYRKALIVGPKRVIEHTWPSEIEKWTPMPYIVITGNVKARQKAIFDMKCNVHLISRDNFSWLVDEHVIERYPWPYELIIIDELTSFKSPKSDRFRSMRRARGWCKQVIGMTGTPSPNGLKDLWGQISILDKGKSLGRSYTSFLQQYFNMTSWSGFPNYQPRPEALSEITEAIKHLVISVNAADYVKLPQQLFIERIVKLPKAMMALYDKLKQDMVLSVGDKAITAMSAGALVNKLLQFCGGKIYDENHAAQGIHRHKLDELARLVEEANGEPLLVYYAYTFERDAIMNEFKDIAVDIKSPGAIDRWNKGEIKMLVAHPASAGHGLNLQHGGSVAVWYNLTYDLELYLQANKRLHRIGQEKPVRVYVILTDNCIDRRIYSTVLAGKQKIQENLLDELKSQ